MFIFVLGTFQLWVNEAWWNGGRRFYLGSAEIPSHHSPEVNQGNQEGRLVQPQGDRELPFRHTASEVV